MTHEQISFSGRILNSKKDALIGVEIYLINSKTKELIKSTLSGDDGYYYFNIYRKYTPKLFSLITGTKVILEVQGKAGRPIAKSELIISNPKKISIQDIYVNDTSMRNFKPEAELLERISGNILDKSKKELIISALSTLYPPSSPEYIRYSGAVRCPAPDFDNFDNLLDDVWGIIDGDPRAELRFRETLNIIEQRSQQRQGNLVMENGKKFMHKIGLDLDTFNNTIVYTDFPPTYRTLSSTSLLPNFRNSQPCPSLFRELPTYIAASMIARDSNDAARLFGSIEEGLCGKGRIDSLFNAADEGFRRGNFNRMQGMLNFITGECGPDDGPLPPQCPDIPDYNADECYIRRLDCLMSLKHYLERLRGSRILYHIDNIIPNDVCTGTLIVITGNNFGNTPGQVCFSSTSINPSSTIAGETGICTDTVSWSDTEIQVIVPNGAIAGDIYLSIVEEYIHVCGKIIPVKRKGSGVTYFSGGDVVISSLSVNNRSGGHIWFTPNSALDIAWNVVGTEDSALVRIRLMEGSRTILDNSGLPYHGSLRWPAPDDGKSHTYRIRCDTIHTCGNDNKTLYFDINITSEFSIMGMEVTQATQHFRPNLQFNASLPRADMGSTNSVPLLENRRTLVRVYLDSGLGQFDIGNGVGIVSGISGKLHAIRTGVELPNSPIDPIQAFDAQNADITNNTIYNNIRSDMNNTLNFELPREWTSGNVDLTVEIDPTFDFPLRHSRQVSQSENISFVSARPLKLVGVMINYTGWEIDSSGNRVRTNQPAPNFSSLTRSANWLRRTYPINSIDFYSAPGNETITFSGDLTNGSGAGCGTQWGNLMNELKDLASDYSGDEDTIWVGILPRGWGGSAWGGCGGSASGAIGAAVIFSSDRGPTLAQEAGHGYGRDHAPGCGAGGPDPQYPPYNSVSSVITSSASIGEYGVDWPSPGNTQWQIQDPRTQNDFMSYCGSDWVSPYTYEGLFNGGISSSSSLPSMGSHHYANVKVLPDGEKEILILSGTIWKTGQVELRPSFHFLRKQQPSYGYPSKYYIELRDKEEKSINNIPILFDEAEKNLISSIQFSVPIPMYPNIYSFLIHEEESVIHEVILSSDAPMIHTVNLEKLEKKQGQVSIFLDIEKNKNKNKTWHKLRYSHDNGETWLPLIVKSEKDSMTIDLSKMPGGQKCLIEAYITDGIRTSRKKSKPFTVERKKPRVILTTEENIQESKDRNLRFIGAGIDDRGYPVDSKNLIWTSNKDGAIGIGDTVETNLTKGVHKITLSVTDHKGLTNEESIKIKIL